MGFYYILAIIIGAALYIKFTFFNRTLQSKQVLTLQLSFIGIGLVVVGLFMLTPLAQRVVDLLF